MSYILDALKKSEKERQKRTVPDPLEIHDYIAHETKKRRPVWAYALSIVVILNIGLLFYWMNPWQAKKAATSGISSERTGRCAKCPCASCFRAAKKRYVRKRSLQKKKRSRNQNILLRQKHYSLLPFAGKSETRQAAGVPPEKIKEKPVHSAEAKKSHATAANELSMWFRPRLFPPSRRLNPRHQRRIPIRFIM